jgi:hypothetical protein
MKRGAAVGLVMLLATLLVVLLLVARSWRAVAPQAIQVTNPGGSQINVQYHDHGEAGAGDALNRGELPGLGETQQRTDQHAQQMQDALDATNQ